MITEEEKVKYGLPKELFDEDFITTEEFTKWVEKCDNHKHLVEVIVKCWEGIGDGSEHEIRGTSNPGKVIWSFYTLGLSHNESIVRALKNSSLWMLYWYLEQSGGYFELKIPKKLYDELEL